MSPKVWRLPLRSVQVLINHSIDAADASYDAALVVGVFSYGHLGPDAVVEILRLIKPQGIAVLTTNDHYEQEGKLAQKLTALAAEQTIELLRSEHGDHIPGRRIGGWVYVIRKR